VAGRQKAGCGVVGDGADHGGRALALDEHGGDLRDLLDGHGIDEREGGVDRRQLAADDLGGAEPGHARGVVLQAEDHAAAQLSLGPLELGRGRSGRREVLEAADEQPGDLRDGLRRAAGVEARVAGLRVGGRPGVGGVGEAASLAHLLEQAGGHPSAEDRGGQGEGPAARVARA
jgi:hypothetical protein